MSFVDKLERKLGRFTVSNLILYVIALSVVGNIINVINPYVYWAYFSLDINQILHGQIWRLVTFTLYPTIDMDANFVPDVVWFAIWAIMYYNIGLALERMWGTFRFNLFYFGGVLITILATVATYAVIILMGANAAAAGMLLGASASLDYLNISLFLAFAILSPDTEFLVYFVIPVKAKWLAVVYALLMGYEFIQCFRYGSYYSMVLIAGTVINLALSFFLYGRKRPSPRAAYKKRKRKVNYRRQVKPEAGGQRHRCAVCGRTEKDAPHLEFRYCSKCEGNYEYCSEHLFTHEHVHR